jgi:hypothetical protein
MNQDEDLSNTRSEDEKASFIVASSLPSSHLFEDLIPSADSSMIDVTHLFQQCAQQLTPEYAFLCHEEIHFNLYDAMAASQLGHEKMDCCQVPPYLTKTEEPYVFPRPPPTGLSSAFTTLLWDEWTEPQVLGFALQILVRLQALCTGASVGESTFTCLYAHAPVLQDMEDRLFPLEQALSEQWNLTNDDASKADTENKILSYHGTPQQFMIYVLSLSLSEITKIFRSIVHNADIYEEEDYVAQTYQIPLYTSRHQDIVAVFRTAMNVFQELSQVQAALGLVLSFLMGFYSSMAQLVGSCVCVMSRNAPRA